MTSRHLAALPAAPFARHTGCHRRRRFWQVLAAPGEQVVDDFSRPRQATAPVSVADDLIPFRRNPYDSSKDAA
ncbi:hypothetical protein ACIBK9_47415 [Nonomuraea sp. NPDC050227]|uniref:hypothetical protein n=1 Tax=Nonomuraea sp. NPDC050227 TaxID=3364360 RepID=UPI00379A4B99